MSPPLVLDGGMFVACIFFSLFGRVLLVNVGLFVREIDLEV